MIVCSATATSPRYPSILQCFGDDVLVGGHVSDIIRFFQSSLENLDMKHAAQRSPSLPVPIDLLELVNLILAGSVLSIAAESVVHCFCIVYNILDWLPADISSLQHVE